MKNPFTLPSLLTPDPSTSLAQSLVLQGRTLDCVRAVTRDVASKLQEQGEKSREKADKRNMYLLKEGGMYLFYRTTLYSAHPGRLIICAYSDPRQRPTRRRTVALRSRTPNQLLQRPPSASEVKSFALRVEIAIKYTPNTAVRQRENVEEAFHPRCAGV